MPDFFDSLIRDIARCVGGDPKGAVSNEHARWHVYEVALERRDCRPSVLKALEHEANLPLASATVVRALGLVDDCHRREWISVLPPGRERQFAENRAHDLRVLERLVDGELAESEIDVAQWSTWLQRRAAERIDDVAVLRALADCGTTKRVRTTARMRADSHDR